jgi:hypothetical protein
MKDFLDIYNNKRCEGAKFRYYIEKKILLVFGKQRYVFKNWK